MRSAIVRSPRKAKGQGAERRQEILDAALSLYAARGIHAVSTRDIAAAAGISQPALYAYFPSRDEITAELCEQAFLKLRARVEKATYGLTPSRDSFRRLCRVYIDFGLEQPDAYRVAFMIEKARADMDLANDRAMAAGLDAFGCFRTQVAQFIAAGLTRPGDEPLLTQSVWAALHGLASLLIARPTFPWVEQETLIARHIEVLADGVLKPA